MLQNLQVLKCPFDIKKEKMKNETKNNYKKKRDVCRLKFENGTGVAKTFKQTGHFLKFSLVKA